MGNCTCGYTTDAEKQCNGTHKAIKSFKEKVVQELKNQEFYEAAEIIKGLK